MRVVFIFNGLPHYYTLVLNKLSKQPGINLTVIIPEKPGETIGKGVYQSVKDAEFKVVHLKEYKAWYGKMFLEGLEDFILTFKPEIIITHWPYIIGFFIKPSLRKIKKETGFNLIQKDIPFNLPKLQDAHNYYKNEVYESEDLSYNFSNNAILRRIHIFILNQLRKRLFNYADAHVDYIEEAYEIFGSYGVPKEKIFIISNSPDTDFIFTVKKDLLDRENIKFHPHRLIHIGRLVKWKKVDMLLLVLKRLKQNWNDAELLVIGNGPEENNLKSLTKELGLENSVTFLGGIYDYYNLGKHLLSSSIYVLAGMGGLSINEAMTFGKPVICSICDGTEKKLVFDNFNGKYFINDNEESLYIKIKELFDNPGLIDQMGKNSETIIRDKINIRTVIDGYLKAFNYVRNMPS